MRSKIYLVLYIKNLLMLLICLAVVCSMVDVAKLELQLLASQYMQLSDSLQVIAVLGLASIPAILTKIEVDIFEFVFQPPTGGEIDKE